MEGYQCENAHDKGWRYEVAYSTALRLKVHLAGRSGHEAQDQRCRWSEVPNPAQDTHLSYQLTLPPLSTGPDQTPHSVERRAHYTHSKNGKSLELSQRVIN